MTVSLSRRSLAPSLVLLCIVASASARADVLSLAEYLIGLRVTQAAKLLPAGASPLVAVLDTGFEVNHPALRGRLVTGYNAFDGSDDVGLDPGDPLLYTHGTAVASIISSDATLSSWARGVFPAARILPIKVCCTQASGGTMTDSLLLRQGILYAAGIPNDSGEFAPEPARVINISFVIAGQHDPLIVDAIDRATRAGSIVVIAAGEGVPHISPELAGIDGAVGVMAAVDGASRPIEGQPIPVIPAPGTLITALMPTGTVLAPVPSQGPVSGSSFATAVASATAAMMMAANPDLSPADVVSILSSGAAYDAQGLDALLAVQKADDLQSPPPPGASGDSAASGGGAFSAWSIIALLGFGLRRRGFK